MNDEHYPLLSNDTEDHHHHHDKQRSKHEFLGKDISTIKTPKDFLREFWVELSKTMYLAAPATFMAIGQFCLGAITQTFAGQLSTLDLAAVAVQNSVIAGFSYGALTGMGSALETLCGQAFGAGQVHMLSVYMQRSWIILIAIALLLTPTYIFATPILRLIGVNSDISDAAGRLALWMIPQLFAYAMNTPIIDFLLAQRKAMVMAVITAAALVLHAFFSWLLMLKLGWGLIGGAVVLNGSWWFIIVAELVYIFCGYCGEAWMGFSWEAFQNLWAFVKLSFGSAVMLCIETWYFMVFILFAGNLKNAEVSVDALSIGLNILSFTTMVAFGFNAAVSVRVSNELGAAHPRTAKFSVVVSTISTTLIGLITCLVLLIWRNEYPSIFSNSKEVQELAYELTPILALGIIINTVQPVLSGVAIGAGWQGLVGYINIGCYYILGIPLSLVLGYTFELGIKGILSGMVYGTFVQTIILSIIVYKTNWNKEASMAEERLIKWGGSQDLCARENGTKI